MCRLQHRRPVRNETFLFVGATVPLHPNSRIAEGPACRRRQRNASLFLRQDGRLRVRPLRLRAHRRPLIPLNRLGHCTRTRSRARRCGTGLPPPVVPCPWRSPSRGACTSTRRGSPARMSGIGRGNGVAEEEPALRWSCWQWRREVEWRTTLTVKFQREEDTGKNQGLDVTASCVESRILRCKTGGTNNRQ